MSSARDVETPVEQVVGREAELARLSSFVAGARAGSPTMRALVLDGEPGAGKTTLWEAAIGTARERDVRVLAARPTGAEASLSFAGLTDLLEDVDLATLPGLAAPQRGALEVALLRAEPSGTGPDPRAIATGLLSALRALSDEELLVAAIDDVQWLDGPSADALAFVARRLERSNIRFLLAKRSGPTTPLETAAADVAETLRVEPLSLGATRRLLFDRLGLSPPRRVLQSIYDTAAGNPLFALEFGRAIAERGAPAIGEDMPVPDAVDDLLSARIAKLPRSVRRLLVALALSPGLRLPQLAAFGGLDTVEEAVDGGVLLVDGDRVRVAHPLLAAVARMRARASERRELHRELAELVTSETLRARHLALATVDPDPQLARTISDAALAASARGARQEAVELAQQALRLTPTGSAERGERVLALAHCLELAGERRRLSELLRREIDPLPAGEPRGRAYLLLTGGAFTGNDEVRDLLEKALAESPPRSALRTTVLSRLAINDAATRVEDVPGADARAREALRASRRAGPETERLALHAVAWTASLSGRQIDDVCERFRSLSGSAYGVELAPERVAGQRLVWRGETEAARELLTRLLAVADAQGESVSYALQRLHLLELELRLGRWDDAETLLGEWSDSSEHLVWPMYERCRALLAAGRGDAQGADRWAGAAIARAERRGVGWDRLEGLRAAGLAALLAHDHTRAGDSFRAVWEHTERQGVADPGAFPVAPELVEVLVEVGETDEAAAVTRRLGALAEQQGHPWGLATTRRCAALVRFGEATCDEDTAALDQAASAYESLGLSFDQARTLLALGRAQRRLRKWGSARRSLEQARAILERLGSPGWVTETQSELDRLQGRRPQRSGELSPAETRVAALAAEGLSNKQIAATLYVTVHTVEVHLKHVYAKLGITSRGQLPRRLPGGRRTP